MLKIKKFNKLIVIALFAVALATPLAVNVYAQDEPENNTEEITETETTELEEVVEEVPAPETEEVEEEIIEEVIEEDEEPVVEEPTNPVAVSLAEAVLIAQAEHPDVEVVMAKVKLKKLDDEKVFKVVFADGWRIYVRASDGEIVRIKDASNKKHDCGQRGVAAAAAWRKKFHKKWGHDWNERSRRGYWSQKQDWWEKYRQNWSNDNDNNDEVQDEQEVSESSWDSQNHESHRSNRRR